MPSVIYSSYNYNEEMAGLLYVNIGPTAQVGLRVTIDPAQCGLAHRSSLHVDEVTVERRINRGAITEPRTYSFDLPPREVVLLEIR